MLAAMPCTNAPKTGAISAIPILIDAACTYICPLCASRQFVGTSKTSCIHAHKHILAPGLTCLVGCHADRPDVEEAHQFGIKSRKLFTGDLGLHHIWRAGQGGDLMLTEEAFQHQIYYNHPQVILTNHVRERIGDRCTHAPFARHSGLPDV